MVAGLCGRASDVAGAPEATANAPATNPPATGPGSNFTREAFARGLRDAPGVLGQIGIACSVTQAVFAGDSSLLNADGKTIGHARLYEVACAEGLGYLLSVRDKEPPVAFDCIRGGQTGKIACMLPLNVHPAGGLNPALRAAGVTCQAARARYIGQDFGLRLRRYEVSCGAGVGYVLDTPLADGSGSPPKATPCFEVEDECRLTSHVQNVARLAYGAGKSFGSECQISDARYVGFVAARAHQLYEVSCQPGHDGELIEIDHAGTLKSNTFCSKIKLVGAACQLKSGDAVDPRIVEAESAGARPLPPLGGPRDVLTNPDWIRRPSGELFNQLFPQKAIRYRVNGRAEIGCTVAATGFLEACEVIDESPAEFGFGAAALKMAGSFQMRPMTRNGVPVTGAQVHIPIVFAIRHG